MTPLESRQALQSAGNVYLRYVETLSIFVFFYGASSLVVGGHSMT